MVAPQSPTSPEHPAEHDPQPSIGFKWGDLFPDAHPERRRNPRERARFFTSTAVLVLVAWVTALVGPFMSISGRWQSNDTQSSIMLTFALLVPAAVGIASMVWAILRFRKAQLAWPIPLIGAAIIFLSLVIQFVVGAS